MKTFFLALILGIFIGSIATTYFSSPDAYKELVAAKSRLMEMPSESVPVTQPAEPLPSGESEIPAPESSEDAPPPEAPATLQPETPSEPSLAEEEAAQREPVPTPEVEESEDPIAVAEPEMAAPEAAVEEPKPVAEPEDTVSPEDLALLAKVQTQLSSNEALSDAQISVSVSEGVVTLSGTAPSKEAKQLAIELAVFTDGVASVEEEITIESKP